MRTSSLTAAACAAAALLLVACGDPTPTTEPTASSSVPVDNGAITLPPIDTVVTTLPATPPTAPPTTPNPNKPAVKIPTAIPTTLVVTELKPGTGDAAVTGDTVVVHYTGVRSRDGVEFDSSYNRGEPFPVNLGAGGVIKGWDDGLVGAKAGAQIQLDIPSELAYGAEAKSDVIGPNEALTFVVDVVAVIKTPDPANAPTEPPAPSKGATELGTDDLIPGEGDAIKVGQSVTIHVVAYQGDPVTEIDNTWKGAPGTLQFVEDGMFPGLFPGMEGMKPGGRRLITIPFSFFEGRDVSSLGLPANTDLLLIVDLIAAY